jgi:hypothetical protein
MAVCREDAPPPGQRLQAIEDTAYPQDFLMAAEDEAFGGVRYEYS